MTWSMHFVDDTDGLVHHAVESYAPAALKGTKGGAIPEIAYTKCGYIVTWDGARVNAGTYVPRSVALTCVRCAVGAHDGEARRQAFKQVMFAQLYGKTTDNVLYDYTTAEQRILKQWLKQRPFLERCGRLSKVLYLKATEADRA